MKTFFKGSALTILFVLTVSILSAQHTLRGIVTENTETGVDSLIGVTLQIPGTETGVLSDETGHFALPIPGELKVPFRLAVSLPGYRSDTIEVPGYEDLLEIILTRSEKQKAVEIIARQRGTILSSVSTQKTEILTQHEFTKAACCNLSESFETNATVDVSYSDAVTGIKEVTMLGLAGVYTQITNGNQPSIRGLGRMMGMDFIPGTWVNSVQIAKGTGSVVNGYESLAGQINIDMLAPHKMRENWIFNVYGNSLGRFEGNLITKFKINERWSGNILLHSSTLTQKIDRNKDGFMDVPRYRQYNVASLWKYEGKKGFEGEFRFQAVDDYRTGGQMNFNPETDKLGKNRYGLGLGMRQAELASKTGYVFRGQKYKSIGLQLLGVWHKQDSYFGIRPYAGEEHNFNANLIYQTKFISEKHTLKLGASYTYDQYREKVDSTSHFARTESVPGIFTEITLKLGNRLTSVAGLRYDRHNIYGNLFTPRLHLRYNIDDQTTLQLAGGKGYRVANVYPENLNILTSSRQIFRENNLDIERAWNYGLSITRKLKINEESGSVSLDLYRTDFINQTVIDMDQMQEGVYIYNLKGTSFSNSVQIQWNQFWTSKLETRVAYKYYDVQTDFLFGRLERPMVARHRLFFNAEYGIGKFSFDFTFNLYGPKRLPRTDMNPEIHRRPSYSPTFGTFNAQITYKTGNFDFYIGGENIGNFRQNDPILTPETPFGKHFDTSFAWGPIIGSIYYAGIRYKILPPKTENAK